MYLVYWELWSRITPKNLSIIDSSLLVSCNWLQIISCTADTQCLPVTASTSAGTRQLTLQELINFRTSSGTTINIFREIGTNYSKLGPLLLNDDVGAATTAIASQYQYNAEPINQEIITQWLQGRGKLPVSWSTLTNVLKEAGLVQLSRKIQGSLSQSTTDTSGEMDTTHIYMYVAAIFSNCFIDGNGCSSAKINGCFD